MPFDAHLPDRIIRDIYLYWMDKVRQYGRIPSRNDIDPLDVPELLPNILIADRISEGRIHHRLVGTDFVLNWGGDITNRYLDEVVEADYYEYIASLYFECAEKQLPLYSESSFLWDPNQWKTARRLMLPLLGQDSSTVDMVLVGQTWEYGLGNLEPAPVRILFSDLADETFPIA